MKILILLIACLPAFAQKEADRVMVLKIDSTDRGKIEQWTRLYTFPDIIVFIKDDDGNYVTGKEVLSDPAYERIEVFDGKIKTTLRQYLLTVTDTVTHKVRRDPESINERKLR